LTRFLIRVHPRAEGREEFLSAFNGIAASLGLDVKHPRWSSKGSLEVDVFAPSPGDLELMVAAVEPLARLEFARNLDVTPPFRSKEEVLAEAIGYFNSERFWEAHETLESVWRPAQGDEKKLIQAMILVCAALVHVQRGEPDVALGIYKRALPQIRWEEKVYHGVDVPRLRARVQTSIANGDLPPFKL